jgi:probable HAF family extracellular repeat protein
MLGQMKWARTGLAALMIAACVSGGLGWAAKPVKPPPEPEPEPDPPITYRVTYLGVLPGNDQSISRDMNNDGTVVGYSYAGQNWENNRRAFVSYIDDTGERVLKDLNDVVEVSEFSQEYVLTLAYGINDRGQIVGGAWVPGDRSTGSSFRFTPGYFDEQTQQYVPSLVEDLSAAGVGMTGDWAVDINDHGDVIGNYQDGPGNYRGYLYSDRDLDGDGVGGDLIDIGDLGVGEVWPKAINNLGEVVGYFSDSNPQAFVYSTDEGMSPLVFGQSDYGFCANDINDAGFVVGLGKRSRTVQVNKKQSYTEVEWYAFRYDMSTGECFSIGKPEGASSSEALAINADGDIVGNGSGYDNFRYFPDLHEIWTLDDLASVELQAHPEEANINDFGEICGTSVGLTGGYYQAFLLTPDLP